MAGKYLRYFLMDGMASGRIKCTLGNWTGVAYRIPRVKLVDCKSIEYLKQSGVYFLFSKGEGEKPLVYIGQAGSRKNGEGILNRLKEHHANPKQGLEDWYEAIAFTTSGNTFGATEISWLENRFFSLATATNRYEARNSVEPNAGNVIEEIESELEEYVEYAKLVVGVLGHYVFEPLIQLTAAKSSSSPETAHEPITYEINVSTIHAKGQLTSDGFVLLEGSGVTLNPAPSCPKNALKQRETYAEKYLPDGRLKENILLRSAHEAAGFVLGYPVNAREAWKTADGKTLKNVQTSEASELV
jgi:hypothetical protein